MSAGVTGAETGRADLPLKLRQLPFLALDLLIAGVIGFYAHLAPTDNRRLRRGTRCCCCLRLRPFCALCFLRLFRPFLRLGDLFRQQLTHSRCRLLINSRSRRQVRYTHVRKRLDQRVALDPQLLRKGKHPNFRQDYPPPRATMLPALCTQAQLRRRRVVSTPPGAPTLTRSQYPQYRQHPQHRPRPAPPRPPPTLRACLRHPSTAPPPSAPVPPR